MLKVAITGNIASGKSTVENYLKEKGFKVFDADKIAHTVLDSSVEIKKTFPDFISNDKIDRKKLGNYVFQNKEKLKELENIVHPKVRDEILKIFKSNKDEKAIFVSVPQLFEANFQSLFDKIILVTCDAKIRLSRLMARNNLSYEEASIRILSQMPEDLKIEKSDFIINNNSEMDVLNSEIERILSNIC